MGPTRLRLDDLKLTLVSRDPDTLWGVHDYLTRVGASLKTTSQLEQASEAGTNSDAIVLFADEYPYEAIVSTLAELPPRLVVIVTGRTNEFEPLRNRSDLRARLVVLRRPTWGWMLLDAVRAGVSDEPEAF